MTQNEVTQNIERACKTLDLTQAQLARIVGVTESTISRWANGKTNPNENESQTLRALLHLADLSGENLKAKQYLASIISLTGKSVTMFLPLPAVFMMLPLVGIAGLLGIAINETLRDKKEAS